MRHCSVSACKTFVLGRTIASAPRICPKSALSLLPLIRPTTTFPTTRIRDEKLDAFGVPGHHPTFTPYSQGVKANVVFFTKGEPTSMVWMYDGRTNVPGITKKGRPLTPEHFAEFEKCYGDEPNGRAKRKPSDSKEDRWRAFTIQE